MSASSFEITLCFASEVRLACEKLICEVGQNLDVLSHLYSACAALEDDYVLLEHVSSRVLTVH